MAKVQVGGAGGAPSNNFIRSLRESKRGDYLIGTSSVPSDLFLADVDDKHAVPWATAPDYHDALLALLKKTKPDFLHAQNDYEVREVSRMRYEIEALGVTMFLPSGDTVETCVDKWESYKIWKAAGVRVPKSMLVKDENDLREAFEKLGSTIWIRATVGGSGRGALPADDYEFAKLWIDRFSGWGTFSAAELLSKNTVTWLSIWHQGELVVAQTRRRRSWNFGNRTLSGVTGITGVGETVSDETVDRVATDSILAIDKKPHGIFGVDMAYDHSGFPHPTEINIGRFFTTHYFFTAAGLNMPEIYTNIALDKNFPSLQKKTNPLPDGLVWIRGMDVLPVLTTVAELSKMDAIV